MKIKFNLFLFILVIEIIFLCIVLINWKLGIAVPILRQLIAFVYLTFVPGLLIIKLLDIKSLELSEYTIYSVGLSLSFLMFIGVVVNIFYPLININKPISRWPLLFTIYIINLFLTILVYYRNRRSSISKLNIEVTTSPLFLTLSLLPMLTIFGTYLLNYNSINTLVLVIYIVISIIPIFITFNKIPSKMYQYTLWVISISLLLSVSLSIKYPSQYLSDSALEYYYANLVLKNGVWDAQIWGTQNSMLRIVLLHPIYSILLNLNLIEEFRIVHPILYSFTPVAIYLALKHQVDEKISFLSTYFFMSFYPFYVILSRNTRTGIAELFLSLFIFTMINKKLTNLEKSILLVIFILSIPVSHYGTAYLLLMAFIIYIALKNLVHIFRRNYTKYYTIRNNIIILYILSSLSWYIYTSTTSAYIILIHTIKNLLYQLLVISNFKKSYVSYAMTHKWVLSVEVCKYMLIIATVFIAIGIVDLIKKIIKKENLEFQNDYVIFSIAFFIILMSCILPTKIFNPARVYHISLCFIAPYIMFGFIKVCKLIKKDEKINIQQFNYYLKLFTIFIVIFALFNLGVISETLTRNGDYSPNIIISKPRALNIKDSQFIKSYYTLYFSSQDISSAKWLSKVRDKTAKIYMDNSGIFYAIIGPPSLSRYYYAAYVKNKINVRKGYIFLYTLNTVRKVSLINLCPPEIKNITEVYPIYTSSRIYTNKNCQVYYNN